MRRCDCDVRIPIIVVTEDTHMIEVEQNEVLAVVNNDPIYKEQEEHQLARRLMKERHDTVVAVANSLNINPGNFLGILRGSKKLKYSEDIVRLRMALGSEEKS